MGLRAQIQLEKWPFFLHVFVFCSSRSLTRFYPPSKNLTAFPKIILSLSMVLQPFGLLGLGISPSQGRYLHITTQTQNKRTHTPMPRVGFQPTIPVFERAKTVHALNRTATVIDRKYSESQTMGNVVV
jgi:hypothetical protein